MRKHLLRSSLLALLAAAGAAQAQITQPQVVVGGVYNASPITVSNQQAVPLQQDANGFLKVNVATGGGSGGTSSSFAAAFPGTGTAAGFRNAGANMDYALVDASHNLQVNGQADNITQIGGNNVAATGVNGSFAIGGPTASGSSIAGNPLTVGGRAENAEPTAVANGQVVNAAYDFVGRAIVFPYANKENLINGTASTAGTTAVQLAAAPGASTFNYITSWRCTNSGATGTTVTLAEGGTIDQGFAASGTGFSFSYPTPIGGLGGANPGTVNSAVTFTSGSATTSLICSASGFKGT